MICGDAACRGTHPAYTMPAGLSLYFDLLRVLSALAVVLYHLWPQVYPDFPLPWPGHSAVIVFFVLSGYMIAHVADRPGMSPGAYARQRAIRILSVALPALLLSAAIAPLAGETPLHSSGPMQFSAAEFLQRLLASLLFLCQSWRLDLLPPYNPPYWSLCYEVWYYIIFGLWRLGPARWRGPLVVVAAICAGPRALVLMPVWLMGVAVHRLQQHDFRLPPDAALSLFWLAALAAFLVFWLDLYTPWRIWLEAHWPQAQAYLRESARFGADYLLGLAVTANFIAALALERELHLLLHAGALLRSLASYTYSVYLFHMPVTVLLWNGFGLHSAWLFIPALVWLLYVFGRCTEHRLPRYRRLPSRPVV
jgi:peptidoglycan/LPS O-acetylase OafA/YrhL